MPTIKVKPEFKNVFTLAANHFVLSLMIGFLGFFLFYGQALSDTYAPTPLWMKALVGSFWVLQTPSMLLAHTIHQGSGLHLLLLIVLGYFWSLTWAFIFLWSKNKLNRRRPSG
jgi:hypothetical protein